MYFYFNSTPLYLSLTILDLTSLEKHLEIEGED